MPDHVIKTDLKCYLNKLVEIQYLKGNVFSLDNAANQINVFIYNDYGEPVSPGGSVTANVIRSDGKTVAVTGDISDNCAYVIFPQAVYAVPGPIIVTIKLTVDTTVTTIAAFVANVYQSSTDTIVDPGTIISSVEALINQINTVLADLPPTYTVLWQTFADPFSDAKDYKVGEYVSNDSQLWQFVSPHTAGTWNAGEVVNPVIGNDLYDIVEFTRAAEITSDLDYTTTGVTFQQTEDPTVIKMFGTCTGTRRVLFLNGLRTVKTASSEFTKVLDEGVYYIQTDMTGYQTTYGLIGTYTTFASSSTYFTITGSSSKKNVVAKFNAPVMVGLTITSSRNYGTEDNPTYFKISILKKTAVDLYSRDLVTKHGYAIDMINKRRIAFGDIDNRGTALNVDQKWNIITINGLSNATSAQSSTKILLTGPLTVRNDIDPIPRELVYPIKLLEDHVYRYGLNVLSGTRTLTSSSGTGRMTMRLHDSSETELSRITLELESTGISGTIIGNGENIKVSVYVGRYLQCTDLVMDVYLEDITEEMEFAKVNARLMADEQAILTKADETATNTRFTAIEDILPTKANLEQTKNLWTLGDQVLTATKRIDTGVSIPFASSGKYTLSADIESEATGVTINVYFEYREGYSSQPIASFSGLTIGGHKSVTLNAGIIGGMTANFVMIGLSSTPSSSITMSNIQLEFGASATEYVPPLVPNDHIARDLATKANTRLDSVENTLETELAKKASIIVNSASGGYVALHDGNDGSPFEEITVEFTDTIQEGSGDPSPENIRNILLYKRLNFESAGKNIFDLNNVTIVEKSYIKENGDIAYHTSYNYCETYIRAMPNTKYTVSYMTNGSGAGFTVPFYDENGDFISRAISVAASDSVNGFNSGSFITPANAKYFRFSYTRTITSLSTLQIEEGDTCTDHEDFSGQHIVIPWLSNMQGLPFAGGKVVFYKDGTYSRIETRGVYTINSGSVIDECDIASTGVHYIKTVSVDNLIKGDTTLVSNQYSNVVASAPNPGSTGMRITENCFYIYDDRFTDLETASNLVAQNPIKIVYTLSEPIVKSPRALSNGPILTALGNNYLWAEAQVQDDSIVECDITAKYDADTKLYVDVRAPIPSYPTDGGLYLFRATVVDNIVTYDWVPISSASGGSF